MANMPTHRLYLVKAVYDPTSKKVLKRVSKDEVGAGWTRQVGISLEIKPGCNLNGMQLAGMELQKSSYVKYFLDLEPVKDDAPTPGDDDYDGYSDDDEVR